MKTFGLVVCISDQKFLIAYGPNDVIGIDEDDKLVLGCFSYYHCDMATEYSWFINGVPVKEERKASLLYAYEPGQYQCVVKINDNVEKSEIVNIVTVKNMCNPPSTNSEQRVRIENTDRHICDVKLADSGEHTCKSLIHRRCKLDEFFFSNTI